MKSNNSKYEIIVQSLKSLQGEFGDYDVQAGWEEKTDTDGVFDAVIHIMNVAFTCEIKENITKISFNYMLASLREKARQDPMPCLLLTRYISPILLKECIANGINVLDCMGNFHILYEKNGRMVFLMSSSGKKNNSTKQKRPHLFSKTNLKVIFYFLNNPDNVRKSYREIQEATEVSLGSIQKLIKELIDTHYILVSPNGRFLKNQKELLEQWTINYNQILKPELLLGTMSFHNAEDRNQWRMLQLPEGMYWSGECGVQKMNGYLEPGDFEIYTDIPAAHLLKTKLVKQNPSGEICLYRKFWKANSTNGVVPPVLVYADLMGSGNSRCIDAAQRLLENELKDLR